MMGCMRQVTGKPHVGIGMALLAGFYDVLAADHGFRIARLINVMGPMTVGTLG